MIFYAMYKKFVNCYATIGTMCAKREENILQEKIGSRDVGDVRSDMRLIRTAFCLSVSFDSAVEFGACMGFTEIGQLE